MNKLETVYFNYEHSETEIEKDNIYELTYNPIVKGLKKDFDLLKHLREDFQGDFFHNFTSEESFLIGIAIGRGLLTLEDHNNG